MASTLVGLDFGNGVLRAAELADLGKPRPTIVRYHSIAVPASAIQRGEVIEKQTIAASLKQLWSTAGFKTKRVVIGMGNQRVMVRDLSVPKLPLNQIKESLPFQVQELIPVPVADAILDFYPVSLGHGDAGEMVNGLLIASVKEPVLANVEAVQAAGLEPVEVDLLPFAICRAALVGANAQGTAVLVHVGAVTTTVVVATDGVPQFVRFVQLGGEDITNALVKQLSVEVSQADKIKRGFGLAPQGVSPEWRPAIDVISGVVNELVDSIRNTISFYVNTHPGQRIARILLTGGGAQLSGLAEVLADAVRLPVGLPDPLERFVLAKSANLDSLRNDLYGAPVAAGLAMGSRA